jgi:hypothetical protein
MGLDAKSPATRRAVLEAVTGLSTLSEASARPANREQRDALIESNLPGPPKRRVDVACGM